MSMSLREFFDKSWNTAQLRNFLKSRVFENSLEIAPYHSPLLNGAKTFDVFNQKELQDAARKLIQEGIQVDVNAIPQIDYTHPTGDLSSVDCTFDLIVSSHCAEHQPNLIRHLQHVAEKLNHDGLYVCIFPDRRQCFDQSLPAKTLAEVLQANYESREFHTFVNLWNSRFHTTHNDSPRHWRDDHESNKKTFSSKDEELILQESKSRKYIDCHAWQFSDNEMVDLIMNLHKLNYITNLHLKWWAPTQKNSNEFALVFVKV